MSALQWVLIAVGVLASATLAGAGLRQRRRRGELARLAERLGLRFAVQDFMNLPDRYGRSLLMQAGHSAYAQNILFGRLGGCFLRAFDYCFEVGHGPQRQVCRLTVVAGDTSRPRPPAAAWQGSPAAAALICAEGQAGPDGWHWAGSAEAAAALRDAWSTAAGPITLLTAGRAVLAACSEQLAGRQLEVLLHAAVAWVEELERQAGRNG